jgi:hypothetical protein
MKALALLLAAAAIGLTPLTWLAVAGGLPEIGRKPPVVLVIVPHATEDLPSWLRSEPHRI